MDMLHMLLSCVLTDKSVHSKW